MKRFYVTILMAGIASFFGYAQGDNPPAIQLVGHESIINCTSNPVRIGVSIDNWVPGFQYAWNTGQNDSTIFAKPEQTQIYTITVSNPALNFYSVKDLEVRVKNAPIVVSSGSHFVDKTTCVGFELDLDIQVSGGHKPYTYSWDNGSADANPSVLVSQSKTYMVTVTDVCNTSDVTSFEIEVEEKPAIEANELTVFEFDCIDEETKIWPKLSEVKGGVGYGYQYTFSDWSESNKSITVNAKEGLTLTALVTDACEMDVIETKISLEQRELEVPTASELVICPGESVELTSKDDEFFIWKENELLVEQTVTPSSTQFYTLTYIDQCGKDHFVPRLVLVDAANSDFDVEVDEIDHQVEVFPLDDELIIYSWKLDGEVIEEADLQNKELSIGEHLIEMTATNKNGCTSTTTRTVVIQDGIEIVKAFTPNGDALNDYFEIIIEEEVKAFKIEIFDRWGQLIYQSNDHTFRWNGKDKANNQLYGAFVYKMKAVTESDAVIEKTGTVSILSTN